MSGMLILQAGWLHCIWRKRPSCQLVAVFGSLSDTGLQTTSGWKVSLRRFRVAPFVGCATILELVLKVLKLFLCPGSRRLAL